MGGTEGVGSCRKELESPTPSPFSNLENGARRKKQRKEEGEEPAPSAPSPLREADTGSPRVPCYQLLRCADHLDFLLMLLGSAGAIVHGSAVPIFLFILERLINDLADSASAAEKVCVYFVYLGICAWVGAWLELSCWTTTGERQAAKVREQFMVATLKQEIGFFDSDKSSGRIASCLSTDILLIQDAISEKAGRFIHLLARFVAGFVVGFTRNWELSLVTLAVMPLLVLCGGLYSLVLSRLTSKSQEGYAWAGKVAEQAISQVRVVYSSAAEDRIVAQYSKALNLTRQLGIKGGLSKGLASGCVSALTFGAWALLFWYGGQLVKQGAANGGAALTAIFAVLLGSKALGEAMPNVQAFATGQAACHTVFSTIDRESMIDVNDGSGEIPERCHGNIELRDVTFSYPSRPDAPIFQGLSLTILSGQTVALVGSSGSGKSTVVSLIERFYDPTGGAVLLDGYDIRGLNLRWLRSQLGLVSQEPVLFQTSIKENIIYGEAGATMEQVEAAARAANAHNFISSLPNGYKTQVGERGAQMSGGQKQRIAIARALLRNPAVLLLDEATSALDSESERVVQEALNTIMVGRTSIVIAHRLSTIRHASSIAVVSNGRLVEQGTHEELIQLATEEGGRGEYASLIQIQTDSSIRSTFRSQTLSMTKVDDNFSSSRSQDPSFLTEEGSSFRPQAPALLRHQAAASFHSAEGTDSRTEEAILVGDKTQPVDGHDARFATEIISVNELKAAQDHKLEKWVWLRLLKLSLPQVHYTAVACLGAACVGCLTPLFANFMISVVVAYYNPNIDAMLEEVAKWAVVFAFMGTVAVLVETITSFSFAVSGEHLLQRIRVQMLSAILRNEVAWFDLPKNSNGAVAARLAADATVVKAAITDHADMIVRNLATVIAAFASAISLTWQVSLVIIATIPLQLAAAGAQHMFLKTYLEGQKRDSEAAAKLALEAVGNMRTVAALGLEERMLSLARAQRSASLWQSLFRGQVSGFFFGLTQFVNHSSLGLGLWYGASLVPDQASLESILKVFMILALSSLTVAESLSFAPDLAKGQSAVTSVFQTLDRRTEMDPDDKEGEPGDSIEGWIELRDVTFAYPTRMDAVVLKNLSLKVEKGQTVALVGASGSGKSSVIALLERFYDTLEGVILIDDKDIRDYNLRSLRKHIGLVSQEPALFATTIRDNILFGRPEATETEVIEAARAANAHSFISCLTKGLDTQVGERGIQLSGGQKQRIAIARALIRNPTFLLLDEATSALDVESESIVQEALQRLMATRSTVIVAHRLSTISCADVIAVMQGGRIVEKGNHEFLMADPVGAYHALVNLQQR